MQAEHDKASQALQPGHQILKTRDDHQPLELQPTETEKLSDRQFQLKTGHQSSWLKPDAHFGPEKLRPRIEPWLTALVQAEHLSLLVGSGLTHAVHYIAKNQTLPGMEVPSFEPFDATIASHAESAAEKAGRSPGNFEDQVRVANELLRGMEILETSKLCSFTEQHTSQQLREVLQGVLETFAEGILAGEQALITAPKRQREHAFNYLVSFLMSFASRTGTRERLQLFTTNYDRYIEAGADAAGLRLIDRFVGSIAPLFRASRLAIDLHYNPPGIRGEPRYLEGVAQFTKLHGSLDWLDHQGSIRRIGLPFGSTSLAPYLDTPSVEGATTRHLMIYPNAAKDRETAAYPYVELFRDFAASICRPNSVLFCYGYSFGDEHINRVIEDMLTIPSSHLIIISYDDPLGRIMKFYEDVGRHHQLTLMLGDHLGNLPALVDHYLPKPAIDRTTFRMAELLRARWGGTEPKPEESPENDGGA